MAAEFDRIAEVYDETRRALDDDALGGIEEMLKEHGCRSVLEVGVGTGRVAVPLIGAGYEASGMDVSRGMMERARAKGVANLFLADGMRAPFRDGSFDAVMLVHVIHVLEDPLSVLREGARVARSGVFALVRMRPDRSLLSPMPWSAGASTAGDGPDDEAARRYLEERRERFRKIAEKYGWRWDQQRRPRNWGAEREILERRPPDELRLVSDRVVAETVEERIARFQKGGYGFMAEMPAAMKQELIEEMRASAASLPEWARRPRREAYQLAMWRPATLLRAP
jgi:SAM-dependent methyltransferase